MTIRNVAVVMELGGSYMNLPHGSNQFRVGVLLKATGRRPLGAFPMNRESFMAFYNFEKFIEVNDGA
jgi:hypothetical protein